MGEICQKEVLSKLILFGENALWQVLKEYGIHYHQEHLHQGKGNELLMPRVRKEGWTTDPIRLRERLRRTTDISLPRGRMSFLTIREIELAHQFRKEKHKWTTKKQSRGVFENPWMGLLAA